MAATEPFFHRMPVRFSDVDHAGIVYYPIFFHYFHLGLEEFLRSRLGPQGYVDLLDKQRIGFPTVSAQSEFLAPLRFGDEFDVVMSVQRLGNKSATFEYEIRRHPDKTVAARAQVVCAITNLDSFRAVEIPSSLRQLFLELCS